MNKARTLLLLAAAVAMPAFAQLTIANPSPLPTGVVTQPYSVTLSTTGGMPGFFWFVSTGSLPSGIQLGSTDGLISGTTSNPGQYNFTVNVSDGAGLTGQKNFNLKINTPIAVNSVGFQGQIGVPFSGAITATGGENNGPYTFALFNSTLPLGLTLNPQTGAITGTPQTTGGFSIQVTATDTASPPQTSPPEFIFFNILPPPLTITTTTPLPRAIQNVAYSLNLAVTGGFPPYSWGITSGSLPPGMTFSQSGALGGTPTQIGTFTFTARVTDNDEVQSNASRTFTLRVAEPLLISTATLPPGTQGVSYSQALTATGGVAPRTGWTVTAGSLPAGMTLNASTGLLGGTPTSAGLFNFTVQVRDSDSPQQTASRQLALTIDLAPLVITTASPLPQGTVGVPYTQAFSATGGTPSYTWQLLTGTLPPGITLGGNTIAGSPTTAGTYNFVLRATDSTPQALQTTKAFALQINPPPLSITTASPLTQGTVGVAYTQAFSATGGTPSYSWQLLSGTLPPGITLGGNTITGSPTTAGTYNFVLRATDSTPTPLQADKAFVLQINPSPLSITTGSPLPQGTVGVAYTQALAATGGTPPYSWQVLSGTLPPGVTLAGGSISGTPTTAGTYNFVLRVTDTAQPPLQADKAFVLQINPPPVNITTGSPLINGEPGAPYNQTLAATGGTPPYNWDLVSGTLPPGLQLSAAGVLSGDISQPGRFTFVLRVRDSQNRSASKEFVLVAESRVRPLEIATTSLPDGTVGVFYGATVFARGGTPPYSISVGGLPPGVSSDSQGGISGTPTRAGDYAVRVTASDNERGQASATFNITIRPGIVEVTTISIPEGRVGAAYNVVFGARGGVPPYTWALNGGTLPSGLSLGSGGDLTGTPTQNGSFTFTVQATDSEKSAGVKSFTLNVRSGGLEITTTTLPNGTANFAYSALLAAVGGVRPYRWSLSGSVPPGLSVNGDSGEISGTPTTPGTYDLNARVTDADSQNNDKPFTVTIAPPLVITTASPLQAVPVNAPASVSFSATGGVQPYVWSVSGGSLPPGMSFSDGQMTGTPTQTGTFSFTVQVTDANKAVTTKAFSLSVVTTLTITTESLPGATVGTAYSATIGAAGGLAPYLWTSSGSLPPGVNFSDGAISGQPTAAGSFTFTVEVRDSAQPVAATATRSFTITVGVPPLTSVTITGLPDNPASGQQPTIALNIGTPQSVPITGTVTLTFAPDAANNADDPAIQFSTGGRSVTLNLPAGQTQTSNVLIQTGTVAGTITLTTALTAGGTPVTCSCSLVQTLRVPRAAPVISSVRVSRSANGFSLVITGFSSTREITRGVFRFSGTLGLQTNEIIFPFTDVFNNYFRGNSQVGGQFVLTMPFVIQGQAGAVTSVSVILSNAQGDSQAVSATL